MLTIVSTVHYVQGLVDVPVFNFKATCFVEEPAGSGAARRAVAGEVSVRLVQIMYGMADILKAEKDCDDDGRVFFSEEEYVRTDYKVEATHNLTMSRHGFSIRCNDDGTYQTLNEYH